MLNSGLNIIIDNVCIDNNSYQMWKNKLLPFNTIFIGVYASLSDLEYREIKRKDRMIGSAKAQYYSIHNDKQYDLIIDTSSRSIRYNMKLIMNAIHQ